MRFAPIVIPTLHRYEKLVACLESLSQNTWADQTEVFVSLDYPPSERYVDGYERIKEYLKSIDILGFKDCHIYYQTENLGAKANGMFLVNQIAQIYDAYILTEDDNVFSPCFLDFINKGLELFENDNRVCFLCGYAPERNIVAEGNNITANCYFGTWGYATWIKKHLKINEEVSRENFRKILKNPNLCKKLYSERPDLFRYFFEAAMSEPKDVGSIYGGYLYPDGRISYIDHTLGPIMCMDELCTIYPAFSLVRNTGVEDGSGDHTYIWSDRLYSKQSISDEKTFDYNFDEKALWESLAKDKGGDFSPAKRAWLLRRIYLILGLRVTRLIMKVSYEISKWRGERGQKK